MDDTFNGLSWPEALRSHMLAAYTAHSPGDAYHEIQEMLDELGDPYTRIVPPR